MLKVGFAFNFNIQRCEIEVGDEMDIIKKGYEPLLKLFVKHAMKADCFISGFSSEQLQQLDPTVLRYLHDHLDTNFKLGTYTYTHPIPQLLNDREFAMQMAKGMELDQVVHKRRTTGFLPPEFAYTNEMGTILHQQGIKWFIALASQIQKGLEHAGIEQDPYFPCNVDIGGGRTLIAVPAAYQLPDTPARFFKLMMKGKLPVDTVVEGVRKFAKAHPDGLLLFKRDAETIFIDYVNSGFTQTAEVMDEFLTKLSALDMVEPVWIQEVIDTQKTLATITLPDYLGNTKLETFTEGAAQDLWDLTVHVRDKIMAAEQRQVDAGILDQAWNHLLLSHNSDGRIGYWFSEWNPGEHTVAPSRRKFIEDNLKQALQVLDRER
jgi:alpha-amylase/alpha-mannosidase (GH57 family)